MKHSILLLALVFSYVACDAPQRTRLTTLTSPNSYNAGASFGSGTGTIPPGTIGSGGTTGAPAADAVTSVAGFSACDITPKYYAAAFGYMGVCQSSSDETIFKVKPSMTIQAPASQVCLIPTYKDASGSSVYIGQPQCTYTLAETVITGKLYKNRTGYESYPLTGLILIQKTAMNDYLTCMNAYINYVSQACPYGYSTNATCAAAANTYRNNICSTFKSTHASSYVDIRLK